MSSSAKDTVNGGANARILATLAAHPEGCYGFDLAEEAGVKVGHLYPFLAALERDGSVVSEWAEPAANEMPRRRYRLVSGNGGGS